MKFRYLFLLLVIVIITGCKATYKLEIKDNSFKESISINSNKDSDLKYFKDNKFYAIMNGASNFKEYKKNSKTNDISFSYNYNGLDYKESTVLKTCFKAYNIINEGKYYLLSTSKGLKCSIEEDRVLLDNLDIIIKSNHKLKDTNADEVNGYKYIWHFNKDNYQDGNIYLKIYKDKYVFNYENEFTIKVIIVGVSVLTILISAFIIIKRVKKAQKV